MPDFSQLTERQKEIYHFIRQKSKTRLRPTVREIGDGVRIKSPNGVMCHLKALEKKGLICARPDQRGHPAVDHRRPRRFAFLGKVAAGPADQRCRAKRTSGDRQSSRPQPVRAASTGNSMITATSRTAITSSSSSSKRRNGERVLSMVDNESPSNASTRKKTTSTGAANDAMAAIIVDPPRTHRFWVVGGCFAEMLVGFFTECNATNANEERERD